MYEQDGCMEHDVHGRTLWRKAFLSKGNITACLTAARKQLESPQHYWENVLWTDETKVELFGKNTQQYGVEKTLHTNMKTSSVWQRKEGRGNIKSLGCGLPPGLDWTALHHGGEN